MGSSDTALRSVEALDRRSRDIDGTVDEIAGFLNAQHARLVDQVVALLADSRLWQGDGLWTMAAWLAWRAGVSPTTAAHVVVIAERADELPACVERFRRGELSLDQMAAVARRAPSWTDAQIAELAAKMTVRQLRRLLATYPFPDDEHEEGDREDDADVPAADADDEPTDVGSSDDGTTAVSGIDEWFSWWWDDDGTMRFSGHADSDTGAILHAALTEAHDHLFRERDELPSWLDALREIAERSLDTVNEPSRRQRFLISVFVDTDGSMDTAAGQPMSQAVQRRLTCDGELIPVMLENGLPVSVGRRQRIVPERTRRIVEHRDGHRCGVPGCEARHFLEVHHIIHWLDDGPTDTWNLICLCPHHHRLHHRGRLGIAGNADLPGDVTFTDGNGRPIPSSGARPIPPAGQPPPTTGRWLHPTGERFDTRWFEFHRPADRDRQTA